MTHPKMTHVCVVREGPMAGNTATRDVDATDMEYETICENCGRPLATLTEMVAWMYERMTE